MITFWTALTALQDSAVGVLQADDVFQGLASTNGQPIPIVTEQKGDILSQIQTCLGSVGICALVLTPTFEFHNNLILDLSGWALLTVTVYEDCIVNQSAQGTGIIGIKLAQHIVGLLHGAPHGVPTAGVAVEPTIGTKFLGIPRPMELISEGPPLQYNVSFQAHVTLNAVLS